jgi:hypothetical protein
MKKSFFASFFSKKEDSSCLPLAWLFSGFQVNGVFFFKKEYSYCRLPSTPALPPPAHG